MMMHTVCSDGDDIDAEDEFMSALKKTEKEEKGDEEVNQSSIWRKKTS